MMNKDTIIRFAAIAAVVVATSATLPLCAAEVAADEAREAAQGWAALQEALTGKDRFAGAEIADVKSYEGKDGRGRFYVVSFADGIEIAAERLCAPLRKCRLGVRFAVLLAYVRTRAWYNN